jgi:hypothetical protein
MKKALGDMTAALDPKGAYQHMLDVEAATSTEDAALLASGESLRTLREIETELGVGRGVLLPIVAPIPTVRYLAGSTPYRYCEKDVWEAVQPHLERLRASWAAEQAVRETRKAARRAAKERP